MKKSFLFLLFLVTTSVFSQARQDKGTSITNTIQSNSKDVFVSPAKFYGTISVNFKNEPHQDIRVYIKDLDNKILFDRMYPQVESKGFKIDLTDIPNGKYVLFVNDEKGNVINETEIERK